MANLNNLRVKIFADGADFDAILKLADNPLVKGFTTNPTLMRKAGITDYAAFGRDVAAAVTGRPVSLEVFADDFETMGWQARTIASWGTNVVVKIPVTTTRGEFAGPLIRSLSADGIPLNITALTTLDQVRAVTHCLSADTPAIVSVFAGRVADTGVDPVPMMAEAVALLAHLPRAELIWASPREVLNIFQADAIGCHIITVTSDLLGKVGLIGKDLTAYSLETVEMFYRDAKAAGFSIPPSNHKNQNLRRVV